MRIQITKAQEMSPTLYTIEGTITRGDKSRQFIVNMDSVRVVAHVFHKDPKDTAFGMLKNVPAFTTGSYKNRSLILWISQHAKDFKV